MTTQARAHALFEQIDEAPRTPPSPRPVRPARTRGQVRQIVASAATRIGATIEEGPLGFWVRLGNSSVDVTAVGETVSANYILAPREVIAALESARDEIRAARLAPVPTPAPVAAPEPAPLEVRHFGEDHPIVGRSADAITAAIASDNPAARLWRVSWKKTSYIGHEKATASADGGRGYVAIDLRNGGSAVASETADADTRAVADAIQAWLSQRAQEAA